MFVQWFSAKLILFFFRIDTALEISNKVRAFYPFPGTFTNGPNGLIKIITTQSNNDVHDQPHGTILNIGKKIFVACGNKTTLEILEVQKPGKNIISASAYLNGIKLSVGDKFGIWKHNKVCSVDRVWW